MSGHGGVADFAEIARPAPHWLSEPLGAGPIRVGSSYVARALVQRAACFLVVASVLVSACAGSHPAPVAPPASAPPRAAGGHFPDGPAHRVRSQALDFPIELMLPERDSWQISDGAWLVAEHAVTSSRLALRTWRAERLVRRSDCEAQARLALSSLPTIREEAVVDRRALSAPAELDTELVVGVEPSARGISGYAVAFGSGVGRCYAAVFTTSVNDAGGEREVATRLGIVVDRVLSGVRVRSVGDRAVRRRIRPLSVTPRE